MRLFVRPNGVFRFRSADGNAVVRGVPLIWTIGVMGGPNEQRCVRIAAWKVVDGRVSLLLQPKCSGRFGNDSPCDRYTNSALGWRDHDRMLSAGNPDLFTFARNVIHCAPRVIH